MALEKEKKVGITVLVALACLVVLVLFLGRFRMERGGYRVAVYFNFVDSLKPDAPVLYGGGVKVGMVEKIEADRGRVKVVCLLNRGTQLPKDSAVTINTTGILGEKYVQFDAGSPDGALVAAGDTLTGRDPGSLDRALARLERLADALEPLFENDKVMGGLAGTLANAREAAANLNEMVKASRGDVEATVRSLRQTSESLHKLTADAQKAVDGVNGMVTDKNRANLEKSLASLRSTMEKLDKVMAKVDKKEGALGALVYDEQMADDLRDIIKELKSHPWKLLWKK